jgi:hypothetical protein
MATRRQARLTEVIKNLEALARRLRADLRRAARETGLTRNVERAAAALRKQAAMVAAQVEKYVHELRMELAKGAAPRRPVARRRST